MLLAITTPRCRRSFTSLHENLDTTPGGRLIFHVFATLAQFSRIRTTT
ncbi:hypothetical protein ACWCOT_40130 [Nonomuraea bangladeshensis]